MRHLKIKNWEKYQHYSDRTPPWIKLYRKILDRYKEDGEKNIIRFLPDSEWRMLVSLWMLAAKHKGLIPFDLEYIADQTACKTSTLQRLLDSGLLSLCGKDDSKVLDVDKKEEDIKKKEDTDHTSLPARAQSKERRDMPSGPEEIQAYLDSLGEKRFTGKEFWDHHEGIGWVRIVGGKEVKIKSWKGVVGTWRQNRDRWGKESKSRIPAGAVAPPGKYAGIGEKS